MKYISLVFLWVLVGCNEAPPPAEESFQSILGGGIGGDLVGFTYSGYDDEVEDLAIPSTAGITSLQQKTSLISSEDDQKVIKSAGLRFESQDLEGTHQRILAITKALNGIISTDNAGKNYSEHFRNITVRIPSEHFQQFIDDVSKGVQFFERKDISRKDVSEEFVDLNARLNAKRELEKRYLELLKQAKNVKEMLEIERELSKIREEIEAKQGRLNYLQDKVALSTISIQFYKYTNETGVTESYGQKMKNALSGGWDGISVFFIGLLYLWPVFLIILILLLLLRRWIKRRKKRKAKKAEK